MSLHQDPDDEYRQKIADDQDGGKPDDGYGLAEIVGIVVLAVLLLWCLYAFMNPIPQV